MTNLLRETEEALRDNNKSMDDVVWFGSSRCYLTRETFMKLSDVEYDSGFGTPEIATDLMVVGEGWWLVRDEYDGSEWWNYIEIPKMPDSEGTSAIHFKQL